MRGISLDSLSRMPPAWLQLGSVRSIPFNDILYRDQALCATAVFAPSQYQLSTVRGQNRPKPSLMVPFRRDSAFVGREDILVEIGEKFEQAASQDHSRVALFGLGGVG